VPKFLYGPTVVQKDDHIILLIKQSKPSRNQTSNGSAHIHMDNHPEQLSYKHISGGVK